ncbi:aspartate aminotransferase family protein, partial [Streptomyces avermitilis]
MSSPPLASGPEGPHALRPLLETVLDALAEGGQARGGPLPAGGPEAVAARVRDTVGVALPQKGDPAAPPAAPRPADPGRLVEPGA